jgi:DNA polymerase V
MVVLIMAERLPTGFHAAAANRAEGRVDLQARFVPHPHATFLVRCASDALTHWAILSGDLCVVDRSLEPRHGDVVIAMVGAEVLVRVLDAGPGRRPSLVGDPSLQPIPIDPETGVDIWGVVSSVIRPLR